MFKVVSSFFLLGWNDMCPINEVRYLFSRIQILLSQADVSTFGSLVPFLIGQQESETVRVLLRWFAERNTSYPDFLNLLSCRSQCLFATRAKVRYSLMYSNFAPANRPANRIAWRLWKVVALIVWVCIKHSPCLLREVEKEDCKIWGRV